MMIDDPGNAYGSDICSELGFEVSQCNIWFFQRERVITRKSQLLLWLLFNAMEVEEYLEKIILTWF